MIYGMAILNEIKLPHFDIRKIAGIGVNYRFDHSTFKFVRCASIG